MVAARDSAGELDLPPVRRSRWRQLRSLRWRSAWAQIASFFSELAPKGLYARTLIIIIAPIVLLESVVAFTFMERHWQAVTRRLSEATARDIAALIDVYSSFSLADDPEKLVNLAREKVGISMQILPPDDLPKAQPKPFFALLDRTLSDEVRKHVTLPFWIDTLGQSRHVEVRVKHPKAVLRFIATRNQNTSVVLLTVAILFMRNQIRPILRLAEAADAFGKGRTVGDDFRVRGAREVRQAAQAFVEMRERIMQHVDQRTTMLAGVSHDLRTVLTRFKLQLAFLGDSPEITALRADVNEMQHMLEDYLAFAKGDGGEQATPTNVRQLLEEIYVDAQHFGVPIDLRLRRRPTDLVLELKRNAFKRAVTNLVSNAARFGNRIVVRAATDRQWLRIEVDDDGPGIPAVERENVFKPFYRLDHARNEGSGNSGLGLAIARDIARSHGGDVALDTSTMGGLRAIIRVPL
ncbi:MAG: HAMP domain-containing protein [Hyphomicrobium sp.]|nr:HAMP domain-containing protein [Hyphomicrobium sp.]